MSSNVLTWLEGSWYLGRIRSVLFISDEMSESDGISRGGIWPPVADRLIPRHTSRTVHWRSFSYETSRNGTLHFSRSSDVTKINSLCPYSAASVRRPAFSALNVARFGKHIDLSQVQVIYHENHPPQVLRLLLLLLRRSTTLSFLKKKFLQLFEQDSQNVLYPVLKPFGKVFVCRQVDDLCNLSLDTMQNGGESIWFVSARLDSSEAILATVSVAYIPVPSREWYLYGKIVLSRFFRCSEPFPGSTECRCRVLTLQRSRSCFKRS